MKKKRQNKVTLNGSQKRYLRGLGHHLEQTVIIGREGLSEALVQATGDVLKARELIKVKLGRNCPLDKKEAADRLAEQTDSCLVQLIGKTILLYRPNQNLSREQRIRLPR